MQAVCTTWGKELAKCLIIVTKTVCVHAEIFDIYWNLAFNGLCNMCHSAYIFSITLTILTPEPTLTRRYGNIAVLSR